MEVPKDIENRYEERKKHWYKYYPFVPFNLSDYFDKVGLLKLYFKLEKFWEFYPAFWIAHYILKNRCEFCKYWNLGSSKILDRVNQKIVIDKTESFCALYKEFYHYHDWCCSFEKR